MSDHESLRAARDNLRVMQRRLTKVHKAQSHLSEMQRRLSSKAHAESEVYKRLAEQTINDLLDGEPDA